MKNNYTGKKEFSLEFSDGSPAKTFLRGISVEFLIKLRQKRRKKMYDKLAVVDTFMVLGIQDLTHLTTLNTVFIDISNSPPYTNFVDKCPPAKFMYSFRLTTVTI